MAKKISNTEILAVRAAMAAFWTHDRWFIGMPTIEPSIS